MSHRLSAMFNLLAATRREALERHPARMLGSACADGNIIDVMLVIDRYPECVHWHDAQTGQTALFIAINHEHLEIANLLIQQGADIHARDYQGISCLFKARMKGWDIEGVADPMRNDASQRARRAYEDAMRSANAAQQDWQRRYDSDAKTAHTTQAPEAPTSYSAAGKAEFSVDAQGYLLSSSGDVVVFADQKAAGRWILTVGNRANVAQVFEIANHPTQDKKFTVQARRASAQAAQQPPRAKGP